MSALPTVSLLMPNRNNAHVLEQVLERLAQNTTYPRAELVVVDDGSTDGSRELLRRWRDRGRFDQLQLIERDHTAGGVIAALNQGLGRCEGELVVQLDADASIETSGWLERMVELMLADDRVGVVTAKVVFDWGEIHTCGVDVLGPDGFHDRGALITEPQGKRTYHQRVLRFPEARCPTCERPAEVDGGIGCCMIYRRDVARELGGYDDGYAPVWFDDLDLTLSMRREGLKVFFTPEVRVVHHVGLRISREPAGKRILRAGRRSAGALLPPLARRRTSQWLGIDRPPAEQWQRIQRHYEHFRRKWGFDMLNPDQEAIRRRWGDTELAWRLDEGRRRAGEQIIAAFEGSRP